jgi:hypothetical protein
MDVEELAKELANQVKFACMVISFLAIHNCLNVVLSKVSEKYAFKVARKVA